ncbi:MAG: hypothetical protein Q9227_008680 [Pyrenula ochraceoflavens]
MADHGPSFVDVTWGAGGRNSQLTCEMVSVAQSLYGLETCMHLTCTDMGIEKVDQALQQAYKAGCTNILALRGDPPRDKESWTATEGGFTYAKDLVKHIKSNYGDHFDIGVAGYPEGSDDNRDIDALLDYLKEKVDAGGTFVVTQMFYDVDNFLEWVQKARKRGIAVPIIPGIMPISTYDSFLRRVNFMKAKVPEHFTQALEPIQRNDDAVREVGNRLVAQMCKKIIDAGILSLHLYTMNLAKATEMVLNELGLLPSESSPLQKALPWRQSLAPKRREEDVRPIFWRNRNHSYIARTKDWDEFPNGRWGDSRSPAFGELDAYGIGLKGTNEANIKLWGTPVSLRDLSNVFLRYLSKRLDRIPWGESGMAGEAVPILPALEDLNQRCLLTINSQPAIDGMSSSDPIHGWGPPNGFVYQKAYLELFVSPALISTVLDRIIQNQDLTYYAVNKSGELMTNTRDEGPNAVTWGIFPNREIVQPTIVETVSFLAWKDEAYRLGEDWAKCYPPESASRKLIDSVMDDWWLVNLVDNDFHEEDRIYDVFRGLETPDMDTVFEGPVPQVNGHTNRESDKIGGAAVGEPSVNGNKSYLVKAEERSKSPLRN